MRQSLNEGQLILTNLLNDMGKEVERILQGCMECLKSLDRTQAEFWIAEDQTHTLIIHLPLKIVDQLILSNPKLCLCPVKRF